MMAELVWVGNILLPRGLVFTAIALIALAAIGTMLGLRAAGCYRAGNGHRSD